MGSCVERPVPFRKKMDCTISYREGKRENYGGGVIENHTHVAVQCGQRNGPGYLMVRYLIEYSCKGDEVFEPGS